MQIVAPKPQFPYMPLTIVCVIFIIVALVMAWIVATA